MIEQAISEIEPLLGTAPACRALGASRASVYRWRTPPRPETAADAGRVAQGAV